MNSKTELKKFISKILNFPSSEITTFGNGITYSKLLKKAYPEFPNHKIECKISCEADKFQNLKIIKKFLESKNLKVNFQIEKIAQCRLQDNLEFSQWLCNHVNAVIVSKDSHSFNSDEDYKADIKMISSKENKIFESRDYKVVRKIENEFLGNNKIKLMDRIPDKVFDFINGIEDERDFYYFKLKKIENILKNPEINNKELKNKICKIFNDN